MHLISSRHYVPPSETRWALCKYYFLNFVTLRRSKKIATPLKYIVDGTGQKTSVLVPVKLWEDLNKNYKKLEQKLKIFNGIRQGLTEVQNARKTGRKLQTMKEFLGESDR